MKKAILFFFIISAVSSFGQLPVNDPNWELVFNDDFNTLDPAVWKVLNNFDHYGGEPQVYTNSPNNVFIDNGSLVLQARNEPYICDPIYVNTEECARQNILHQLNISHGTSDFEGYHFTSGCIETQANVNSLTNFQYGYYEARIRLPWGVGFWPAFWVFLRDGLPSHINNSEIDIVENVGKIVGVDEEGAPVGNKNKMGTNIHKGLCDGLPTYTCPTNPADFYCTLEGCQGADIDVGLDYTLDYHTYAIEWSPTRIVWYFDNRPVRIITNPEINDPVKIIFNFALSQTLLDGSAEFPAQMKIDYVRVYKLKTDCNSIINTCVYDFPSHDNKIKNKIVIGSGGCENSVAVGTNTYLHAANSIELAGDFTIPIGATFLADANGQCLNTLPENSCGFSFNPCNYNFVGYDNGIKKEITLGQVTGCTATVSSGSTVSLKATDEITLKPGFSANVGSNVEMKIVICQ
ncbi:MAG: hypothetical protein JWO44_531 [Bacteroidetes bacterium]|nr:hypothetical protein [Bacteroidota bacterium]